MNKKIFYIIFVFICVSAFLNCGESGSIKKPVTPSYPQQVDATIENDFVKAEELYNQGQYTQSLEAYRQFLNTYGYNRLSDEAYYKIGKIYFLKEDFPNALNEFNTLKNKTPDMIYKTKAALMSGYSAFKNQDFAKADEEFSHVKIDYLPTLQKIRYFSLRIFTLQKLNHESSIIDYYFLRCADIYKENSDPTLKNMAGVDLIPEFKVMQHVDGWVLSKITVDQLPEWVFDYPEGYSKPLVEFKIAQAHYDSGSKKSKNLLSRFVKIYPTHRLTDRAYKMLEGSGVKIERFDPNILKVGVLLPLSGNQLKYGEALSKGIECAAFKLNECYQQLSSFFQVNQSIELIKRDSGNTEESVVKAIDLLALENVSAIIGPLSAHLSSIAAKRAMVLQIPIFPITQTQIEEQNSFVYPSGFQSKDQIKHLVRISRNQGIKSFGVFYPNNDFGNKMAEIFKSEVENSGASLAAHSSYQLQDADFTNAARGLKHSMSRFSYNTKTAGFEILFLPDSHQLLGKISNALQFVTIQHIPLMGVSEWNVPNFPIESVKSYPGTFFLDLFYPLDEKPLTKHFVSAFKIETNKEPDSLEALAFDILWTIRKTAVKQKNNNALDLSKNIKNVDVNGVTSIKNFTSDGPEVNPYIFTVNENGIVLKQSP